MVNKQSMNRKKLVVMGAGGHGKVCALIALQMNQWDEIVFLDDAPPLVESGQIQIPIRGSLADFRRYIDCSDIFVAIGDNDRRAKIFADIESCLSNVATLVHRQSIIGEGVSIKPGTAVMAGVIINPFTKIGKGCVINTGSIIEHDCEIGNFVHISPGACVAGTVRIGERTWLGVGSIVSNNISITSDCIIGAGAVVIHDITEPGVYAGIPAKRLR